MAKKIELTGYFHEIGKPELKGEKQTKVQRVIFMLFGYQNRAQGINEPDEPWLMTVVGKKVDELKLEPGSEGATIKATCYVSGYAIEATKDKPAYFGLQCNLTAVEIINPRA